jgi:hypothetical protein
MRTCGRTAARKGHVLGKGGTTLVSEKDHDDLAAELLAIVRANRDLGPGYYHETVAQILEAVRRSAPAVPRQPPEPWRDPAWERFSPRERRRVMRAWHQPSRPRSLNEALGAVYALSIPLLGVAAGTAHTAGVMGVLGLDALATIGILVKTRAPDPNHPRLRSR